MRTVRNATFVRRIEQWFPDRKALVLMVALSLTPKSVRLKSSML
jgi:hypothetical protein